MKDWMLCSERRHYPATDGTRDVSARGAADTQVKRRVDELSLR